MGTMNDYTTYCTEEQTKRAFKLGAPIKIDYYDTKMEFNEIPTTQQMIGWLKEKGLFIEQTKGFLYYFKVYYNFDCIDELCDENYNIGVNNAIDAALNYLNYENKTI